MTRQLHQYHMVDPSPWPLTGAAGSLLMASGLALWFHTTTTLVLKLGLMTLTLTLIQWWRDVIREGTYQGHHTLGVQKNMRYGMILFITSEVFFFLGFFWTLYHVSLVPTPELGAEWPPAGINPLNPMDVPLLNTAVLLSSGATITWSHHTMMKGNKKEATYALAITIVLGIYFTALQISEYSETPFTISDSVYGSLFFVATGFHGLHVMIGTSFLMICLTRLIQYHFTTTHHFGYEAAIWYWHFVDIVWLFLYVSVYWWGS
uniref:Cytochrome c oxidase subunit 3 n=1 Tax=Gloydius shedaoensis TaxID=88083 RepID=A0A0X8GJM3_GLOSH|nr:cytochrome c oxidase subunit III [Gloydius shedaoensis]AMC18042.1 cytochrome c oxidase subunit III [Gloydius shedaoensis]AMC18055.1 cytochrome c oxidase subunit III [Gloydius shedaoensis]